MRRVNSQSLIFDKLRLFNSVENICSQLQIADSMIRSNDLLYEEIQENVLHFAVYNKGEWLLTFNLKQLGNTQLFREAWLKTFAAKTLANDYLEFTLIGKEKYFMKIKEGIVLVSPNSQAITDASDKKGAKLVDDSAFVDARSRID